MISNFLSINLCSKHRFQHNGIWAYIMSLENHTGCRQMIREKNCNDVLVESCLPLSEECYTKEMVYNSQRRLGSFLDLFWPSQILGKACYASLNSGLYQPWKPWVKENASKIFNFSKFVTYENIQKINLISSQLLKKSLSTKR